MAEEAPLRFSIAERGKGAQISIPSEGTEVDVPDYEGMTTAIQNIRDKSDPSDFILLGYEGDSTSTLIVIGSGTGGVEALHAHLNDDIVAYGLVRLTDMLDERPVIRYAFINWMGQNVPGIRKAKYATNKAAIVELIGTYSVEVLADSLSEISQQEIMNRIQDTSGSRHREANPWEVDPVKLHKRDQPPAPHSKPRSVVPTGKQALDFPNLDVLQDSLAAVRSDSDPTNWSISVYDHKINTVEMIATGNGDLAELKGHLLADKAMFGFLRMEHTVDASVTVKFVFLNWVGESIPPMQRGKIPTLRGAIVEKFEPYHIEIQVSDLDDLTEEELVKRVQHARGM